MKKKVVAQSTDISDQPAQGEPGEKAFMDDIMQSLFESAEKKRHLMELFKEGNIDYFVEQITQLYPIDEKMDDPQLTINRVQFLTGIFESIDKEYRIAMIDTFIKHELISPPNCLLMAVVARDDEAKYHCWSIGAKSKPQHYEVFYDLIGCRIHSYPKSEHMNNQETFFKEQQRIFVYHDLQKTLPDRTGREHSKLKI